MKTRYLTINELAVLRAHLTAAEWLPFAVALETGLRIGDVLKIRVEDLHENKIAYKAEKTDKSGEAEISVDLMLQLHQNADKHGWVFPGRVPGEHLTRQAAVTVQRANHIQKSSRDLTLPCPVTPLSLLPAFTMRG